MDSNIDKPVIEVFLGQEPNLVMNGESHGGSELVVVTEYGATTQAVCTNPGS